MGWEVAAVCVLASHIQDPKCIAARSLQPFLKSLGSPGLHMFPWEFGDEEFHSFWESSLAPTYSSYF